MLSECGIMLLCINIGGVTVQELYFKLIKDVESLGISANFKLELSGYSKTYFGRYDPNTDKITVYVYKDLKCTIMYDYKDLLLTVIHEVIHCMQWNDKSFIRRKGIMHDAEFHALYNQYSNRAKAYLLLREVKYDNFFASHIGKAPTLCCRYG